MRWVIRRRVEHMNVLVRIQISVCERVYARQTPFFCFNPEDDV